MRPDDALDGLLRELARAPEGDDEALLDRARARRRPRVRSPWIPVAALVFAGAGLGAAAALGIHPGPDALASVEYRRDVRPVLETHCAPCHAAIADAAARREGVVPGHAAGSALYRHATDGHAPLPEEHRRTLALWIDLGAAVAR